MSRDPTQFDLWSIRFRYWLGALLWSWGEGLILDVESEIKWRRGEL